MKCAAAPAMLPCVLGVPVNVQTCFASHQLLGLGDVLWQNIPRFNR